MPNVCNFKLSAIFLGITVVFGWISLKLTLNSLAVSVVKHLPPLHWPTADLYIFSIDLAGNNLGVHLLVRDTHVHMAIIHIITSVTYRSASLVHQVHLKLDLVIHHGKEVEVSL